MLNEILKKIVIQDKIKISFDFILKQSCLFIIIKKQKNFKLISLSILTSFRYI